MLRADRGAKAAPIIQEHPGGTYVAILSGALTEADAAVLFGDLQHRVLSARALSTIVYDARTLTDWDLAVLEHARNMLKASDAKLLGVGVVSESARTKFALSALQMATRRNLRSFPTVEEALAWARALGDRRNAG